MVICLKLIYLIFILYWMQNSSVISKSKAWENTLLHCQLHIKFWLSFNLGAVIKLRVLMLTKEVEYVGLWQKKKKRMLHHYGWHLKQSMHLLVGE